MNLYEIDSAMEALIDPETGELLDYEAFTQLQMARDEKLENAALWVKELLAEAAAIRNEVQTLTARRAACERKAERLKGYLLEALNGEKFETPRCAVGYRKATALEVTDLSAAAFWLERNGHRDLVTYSEPSLCKRSVTAMVKAGVEVPGVELVERQTLQLK